MTPPPGKQLEQVIAALEKVILGNSQDATVEAPCRRLRDRDTGRLREHDIVITWDRGHHRTLTAVECRDRSRPVGVPAVEAFAHKCGATGIHHPVIVSSTGFTQSALAKAANLSIQCMSLEEVVSFPWLEMAEIVHYWRHFERIDLHVILPGDPTGELGPLIDPAGNTVTVQQLAEFSRNAVPAAEDSEAEVGVVRAFRLVMQTPGWLMEDREGARHVVEQIVAEMEYVGQKRMIPLTLHRYSGGNKAYGVATAAFEAGEFRARIMMVEEGEAGTGIYIVPDANSKLGLVPRPPELK